jgi:hypothetical protein
LTAVRSCEAVTPPHTVTPARDTVDVAADASHRFATHLELLAHHLGEAALEPGERRHRHRATPKIRRTVCRCLRGALRSSHNI